MAGGGLGAVGVGGELGGAEAGEPGDPVGAEEDVSGLDVAVYDAAGVEVGDGPADVDGKSQGALGRQRPLGGEGLAEGLALGVLGDEVEVAVRIAEEGPGGEDVGALQVVRRLVLALVAGGEVAMRIGALIGRERRRRRMRAAVGRQVAAR